MASKTGIDFIDLRYDRIEQIKRESQKIVTQEIAKAYDGTFKDFGKIQEQEIREAFAMSVNMFYDAYAPSRYKRRNDLYDVMGEIKFKEKGTVETEGVLSVGGTSFSGEYMGLFREPQGTFRDRSGNSLFGKVFIDGWHGGAESINDNSAELWGAHPEPGVPYYRKGGMITRTDRHGKTYKKYHPYGVWGKKAEQSTSAYELFVDEMHKREKGALYDAMKNISSKYVKIMADNLGREISKIIKRIWV